MTQNSTKILNFSVQKREPLHNILINSCPYPKITEGIYIKQPLKIHKTVPFLVSQPISGSFPCLPRAHWPLRPLAGPTAMRPGRTPPVGSA